MNARIFLLTALFAVTGCAWANPVNFRQAAATAKKLLGKSVELNEGQTVRAQARVAARATAEERAFYAFNATDGKGFVLVSGEDEMPALLGYSPTGRFDAEQMPPALEKYLSQYVQMVEAVRNGQAHVAKASAVHGEAVVEPLCQAEWGQEYPYNLYCPQQDGDTCLVGCVATAMAEIMHHFQWPEQGTGSYRYVSGLKDVGTLSSNFSEHTYEWSLMGKNWWESAASDASIHQVAQLSYDCGVATRMNYGVDGSGTNDDLAMVALYTYFGYRASTLEIKRRACYETQQEWDEQVKAELNSNRPVLYGGFDAEEGGHEFIIDGYDDQGNFHVNWGWYGVANGYYPLITLAPDDTEWAFKESQSMICGIEPDPTQQDKTPMQWRIYMAEAPSVNVESIALGKSFSVALGKFYNYRRSAETWTHGVALYSEEGEQLRLLSSKSNTNYTKSYKPYYGAVNEKVSISIPKGTPDGTYTLRAVFRQNKYDDFILPDMVGGSDRNRVMVTIADGVAHFSKEIAVGIATPAAPQVVSREYFDLSGRKLSSPTHGIVMERQRLSDGQQIVRKVRY